MFLFILIKLNLHVYKYRQKQLQSFFGYKTSPNRRLDRVIKRLRQTKRKSYSDESTDN